jgi:hypothetical protein
VARGHVQAYSPGGSSSPCPIPPSNRVLMNNASSSPQIATMNVMPVVLSHPKRHGALRSGVLMGRRFTLPKMGADVRDARHAPEKVTGALTPYAKRASA